MKPNLLIHRSRIPAPAEEVFRWHERPGAFQRLTPPWAPAEVVEQQGGIQDGARVTVRTQLGPLTVRLVLEHRDYEFGRQFCDVQIEGPFQRWEHTHRMEPDGPQAMILEDRIEFVLPAGRLGELLASARIRQRLKRMLEYRHRITAGDLALHQRRPIAPMNVLVSGSSGLVGGSLIPLLTTGGHRVVALKRGAGGGGDPARNEITWDPKSGQIDPQALSACDAVVHLAGESIASGRWTAEKKRRIRDSRAIDTRNLCLALARLEVRPRTLVCASAIGFYGDRGEAPLDETSSGGTGFLAEVCRDWEAATEPAAEAGIRVVNVRFGVVLSPAGGALAKMLTPFRMGLGGVVGSGQQWMSWISIDDAVTAIYQALVDDQLQGPHNLVAPEPVRNQEFTRTLGRVLSRPTVLPMPAFAARAALGEMAEELLLASAQVKPSRLLASDYEFRFPALEDALRHLLGRPREKAGDSAGGSGA